MKEVFPDHLADSMAYFITKDAKRKWNDDKLSVIKPIDYKTLSEKCDEITSLSPVALISNAMDNLICQVNAHFEGLLERKGISIDDYKKYGDFKIKDEYREYWYKNKCIFRTRILPLEMNNDLRAEVRVEWEEL